MNNTSLFRDKAKNKKITESHVGKLFQKLYIPFFSEVLLLLSILVLFYSSIFTSIDLGFLSPWFLLGAIMFCDKSKIRQIRVNYWFIAFILVVLLSAVCNIFFGGNPRVLLLGTLIYLQFGFAFLLGQTISKRYLYDGVLSISVPLAVLGIWQYFYGSSTSAEWVSVAEKGLSRAFATFGSPNVLGILMVIMTILSIGLFLSNKKWWYLASGLLFATTTVITFSRTAWIALLLAFVVMLAIYNYKYLFFLPISFVVLLIPSIRNRMMVLFDPTYLSDATLDGRTWSLLNGIFLARQRPILGFGPGSYGGQTALNYSSDVYLQGIQSGYTALYYTDNQYLEVLVQTGIVGLIAFIGFFYSVIVKMYDLYRAKSGKMQLAGIGIVVAFMFSAVTANVMEFGALSLPVGIIIGSLVVE